MSTAGLALAPRRARHIHLPSVHIRLANGTGYDYEENLYISGPARARLVERVVSFAFCEGGNPTVIRETADVLCPEDLAQLEEELPLLMDEGNPDANTVMQERASQECERQIRIAAGAEQACARCGCSTSRGCSGGCLWATERLCSRCIT